MADSQKKQPLSDADNALLRHDSRKIQPGDTFLCLPGGEAYIESALEKGAKEVIQCTRKEMAELANNWLDFPSKKLTVIGVTGTNGKTSVCSFVAQALNLLGRSAFYQGTLTQSLTTPESLDTLITMNEHLKKGGTDFVLEVSSHGIDQGRVLGVDFDCKCLTNITQDHLDYHKTFENYKAVKESFMSDYPGTSLYPDQYLREEYIESDSIKGDFNQQNLKAAYAILMQCGISSEQAKSALSKVNAPPGRFDFISSQAPFEVVIDYAHTPDGLRRILEEAQTLAHERQGKVITCFGCGGDRDRGKRPLMGKVACEYSDFFVITQDNPRTEDPQQIIQDIIHGITHDDYAIEQDRACAIELCLQSAKKNDIVVIAGKGHETSQIIGVTELEFNDREVAENILKKQGHL